MHACPLDTFNLKTKFRDKTKQNRENPCFFLLAKMCFVRLLRKVKGIFATPNGEGDHHPLGKPLVAATAPLPRLSSGRMGKVHRRDPSGLPVKHMIGDQVILQVERSRKNTMHLWSETVHNCPNTAPHLDAFFA